MLVFAEDIALCLCLLCWFFFICQAAQYPEKLAELRQAFVIEASRYNVFPIDNSRTNRLDVSVRPNLMRGRKEVKFYSGTKDGIEPSLLPILLCCFFLIPKLHFI